MVAAVLCGITDPAQVSRSVCAMGHKWMWSAALGGLPPEEFLRSLDPAMAGVRGQLGGRYAASDQIAGRLTAEWAEKLGLRAGIPIPVGAFDAHWDAIGAGVRMGDVVNVVGTSTCIMAISDRASLIPGVCGVVPGSIHPGFTGIEAGLSATGDIFEAIARRAGTTAAELSKGLERYRAGETGLLRMTWDNGDRTVLVNPELSGVTLGWRLTTTAQDELFAAIEGTAFHTRVILERMEEHGVPVTRIINGGGIPQKNPVLNQVYANVLGKPILVPKGDVTSLGSAIFAFMAAGAFPTIEAAQDKLCPGFITIEPEPAQAATSQDLFALYRKLYFAFGQRSSGAAADRATCFPNYAASQPKPEEEKVLEALRTEVLEANLELVRRGLVIFTFGNASAVSREHGLCVIKPSGVPYEKMTPADMVITDLTGKIVEGTMRPSSDLATHVALYRAFPEIGGVVHTHSRHATAWAQANREIPCFGTTQADYFHGPIPLTPTLTREEIESEYEANTGVAIIRRMEGLDPLACPACLVAGHAPFCWGKTVTEAAHMAAIVEEIAAMAWQTVTINPSARPISEALRDKHHFRKHGPDAYYGQK